MALLRTIVWFIYFFGALILFIPVMYRAKRKKDHKQADANIYIERYVHLWANTLMKIAGVTVTVEGKENIPHQQAVLFTPNHQGNYDIPLMLLHLGHPPALVAKIETTKIPLIHSWMKLLDCVFLDRKNPRKAMEALKQAQNLLENGQNIVVFPEGTRSKGGPLGEFKSGAFKIACKAKAPIVPVVIDGSYRAMEANGGLMKPAHIHLKILKPIETAELSKEAQRTLPETVANLIAKELP